MHSPSFLSASSLLVLLVSTGAADVVTVTVRSTITTCYATPPPPCSTTIGLDSSAFSSLLSSSLNGGGNVGGGGAISSASNGNGSGNGGGGGNGGSSVLPTVATSLSSLSSSSIYVYPTYTSGWNTTSPGWNTTSSRSPTGVTPSVSGNSTVYPTYTSTSSSSSSSSSTATSSSTTPSAPACTDYWLENVDHQGLAPYAPAGYQVFRNVLDFGAKGDGISDDTAAINAAISSGGRCAPGTCGSSTTTPAIVYFPPGTYVVSAPVIDYYYTQLIGNPGCLPVIKASAGFQGRWVVDGDEYQSSGSLGWGATNVFWRQIRNFVIDMTAIPAGSLVAGIHWPTGQASSLQNIVFQMSEAAGNLHQGLFIEEGSGGFVTDLVFYGGAQGLNVGNQQFTMRNLTFFNSQTAILQLWDWGWTYKGVSINNCGVGLDISGVNGNQLGVGGVVMIDSDINNTPVGVRFGNSAATGPPASNNIILENVRLSNVGVAIQGAGQTTVLAGTAGASTISAWGRGNTYQPTGPTPIQGPIVPNARPGSLLSGSDFYERSKPQYETVPLSQFVSIRDLGAAGNGQTDDTAAINAALASAAAAGKILFFDFGIYVVTSTIFIPAGSKIVGESYPVILSQGAYFADIANPKPVVQVGLPGQTGQVEWSDMIVSTRGAQGGATLIEWNLASSNPSGLWDVHTRVGGFAGSNLQVGQCPKTPTVVVDSSNLNENCIAAFMSMHVTASASGLYMENVWLW